MEDSKSNLLISNKSISSNGKQSIAFALLYKRPLKLFIFNKRYIYLVLNSTAAVTYGNMSFPKPCLTTRFFVGGMMDRFIVMKYRSLILLIHLISAQPDVDLDQFIVDRMSSGYIPGLSACAIINDQVVWANSYGFANITLNIPVSDDTNFLLASISKLVTTTAIMQIVENGDIALNDNINQYLPFAVINPSYPETEITLYMLLTHTSSIKEDLTFSEEYSIFGNDPEMELEYFLSNYFTPGGEFYSSSNYYNNEPGVDWHYSNIGFALIALLVENITNQTFEEYCDINIFNPLGMVETSWHFDDMNELNVAMPYEWMPGWEELGHYFIPYYPSAQLRSNVNELSYFLIAYMGYMPGSLNEELLRVY